ncbi:hypothetical protein yinte0001_35150 [Yersinia intermedia ATCC 29909]|nr:hypothetical protein yinte0001_35150 [Yersinia intermedia ATCC 29909]
MKNSHIFFHFIFTAKIPTSLKYLMNLSNDFNIGLVLKQVFFFSTLILSL